MAKAIVRYSAAHARLGDVGRDFFDAHFVLTDENDPFVPGTNIPRLRRVYLGPRVPDFFSEALDSLIDAVVALHAKTPLMPPKPGGAVPAAFHSSVHRNPKRADKRAKPRTPSPSGHAGFREEEIGR
jgi:hypothetical protein